jgi:hypothetical protein
MAVNGNVGVFHSSNTLHAYYLTQNPPISTHFP